MDCAQAFSPGHVTGLFSIHESENPLETGSLGAGFCLADGVETSIEIHTGLEDLYLFNNEIADGLLVSHAVTRLFFKKTNLRRNHFFIIRHKTRLPVGCGFGTSGAGALSLALALNALHDNVLSFLEAAQLAHLAEIESHTGLGTVIGETFGGFEIRQAAGAPGVGRVSHFGYEKDLCAVFLVFGPLSTATFLKNPAVKDRINTVGVGLRQKLQNDPTVENFMLLSQQFTNQSGLLPPSLKGVVEVLGRRHLETAMLMFGNGLFSLVPESRVPEVTANLMALRGDGYVFSCLIDSEGGRVTNVR